MARRRMISAELMRSDEFLALPAQSQLLYVHLLVEADDDGFLLGKNRIITMLGLDESAFTALTDAGFVLRFSTGAAVITHWPVCNAIRKDRHTPTKYRAELAQLECVPEVGYVLKQEPHAVQKEAPAVQSEFGVRSCFESGDFFNAECGMRNSALVDGFSFSERRRDTGIVPCLLLQSGDLSSELGVRGAEDPAVQKEASAAQKDDSIVQKEASVVQKEASAVQKEEPVVQKKLPAVQKEEPVVQTEKPVVQKEVSAETKEAPSAFGQTDITAKEAAAENQGAAFRAREFCPYAPPLPLASGGELRLLQRDVDVWRRRFPDVNVTEEFRKLREYLDERPDKRKTADETWQYAEKWLSRAQNKTAQKGGKKSRLTDESPPSYDIDLAEYLMNTRVPKLTKRQR